MNKMEQNPETFQMSVNFRLPKDKEIPNWLGWFDNEENSFVCYAKDLEEMNLLLAPKTVAVLEKTKDGKLHKVIYEKNGIPVKNLV